MRHPTYFFSAIVLVSILAAVAYLRRTVVAAPVVFIAPEPQPRTQPPPQLQNPQLPAKKTLEIVFAVDTTGSMSGLIDAARQRIWGIVNDVLKGQMAHKVRVGLVAYRDRGDDYVTKVVPLTDDLDRVYSALMDFRAEGGGDTPEDVRSGLTAAVRKSGWSRRSQDVAQILFLVGDAPPHEDYRNVPTTASIVSEAGQRGILIDTIQCGDDGDTRHAWTRIASSGQGEYFAIAQDGGVRAVATPYDRELSTLGGRMSHTYVPYGEGSGGMAGEAAMRGQREMEERFKANAAPAANADRALNKVINASAYHDDLVQQIADGHVKLDALKSSNLPGSIASLPRSEQQREVGKMVDERKALQSQIVDLARKRASFIRSQPAAQGGFDHAVSHALSTQIGRGGTH
jgi:Mg-chelatase subunit ChlD